MTKIAFLGAGSLGFGKRLVGDILSWDELRDVTIHLMDPNAERLRRIEGLVRRMANANGFPTQIAADTDRARALDGADYVIVSIRVGDIHGAEADDVCIPLQACGLQQTVADTVGVGGLMKALRTVPPMLDIARDMERLCPDAVMLNYTNPMAIIMWALAESTSITGVGLCHSVQNTRSQLARYMNVPESELVSHVAGINHMAWFLQLRRNGVDLYSVLRECLDNEEIVSKDRIRFEIFRYFGYFVTESSRHMAEYVPYFMKSPTEMARLHVQARTSESIQRQRQHRRERARQVYGEETTQTPEIKRSNEYAAIIIRAMETGIPATINGNVRNDGLITNLPEGCCVEVPVLVDGAGLHPCHVGALPPQCAGLCAMNVMMQELTVRAILEQNRDHVYHAAMLDPNTHSQLTLPEIRDAIDRLLEAQADTLPSLR